MIKPVAYIASSPYVDSNNTIFAAESIITTK
jgi:hypothetical protein